MALYNPESKPLQLLCDLINDGDLDEIGLYDIVHKPSEFKRMMEENSDAVKTFLSKCYKQTDVTREISELKVPDHVNSICFTVHSTDISSHQITDMLKEEIRTPRGILGFIFEMIL
jgi:hypothetical protein